MEDVRSWHGNINWSEKARLYKIRSKDQDMTPPNAGQMLISFLQSKDVDMSHINSSTQGNENDPQNKFQGISISVCVSFHIYFLNIKICYIYINMFS